MRSRWVFLTVICLLASLNVQSTYALEKMSDAEMRDVTGFSGFISSEEDLKELELAKKNIKGLIQSQSLQNFLPEKSRGMLFGDRDLKPEKEAKLLRRTTRSLLRSPEFLKQVERTGKVLARISKALQRLQSLRQ